LLHLATAIHIVELVGYVVVLAFTAIESIPLLPDSKWHYSGVNCGPVDAIVAIPAVDDVLALASPQPLVVAVTPVEHVIASIIDFYEKALFVKPTALPIFR